MVKIQIVTFQFSSLFFSIGIKIIRKMNFNLAQNYLIHTQCQIEEKPKLLDILKIRNLFHASFIPLKSCLNFA